MALWKQHFGTEITKEQALEKGLRLIRLIEIVGRAAAADVDKANAPTKQDSMKFCDNNLPCI